MSLSFVSGALIRYIVYSCNELADCVDILDSYRLALVSLFLVHRALRYVRPAIS